MNLFAHIVISYIIAKISLIPEALLPIAIFFGILPDFDYLFNLGKSRRLRFAMKTKSRFHELFGLLIFSIVILFISIIDKTHFLLFFPLLSHYVLDYLTRPMRPFNPFSKESVFLKIYPRNHKKIIIADIVITIVLITVTLWI